MMTKGSGWNGWQVVINGLTLVLLSLWWVGTASAADRVEYYHTDALGSVVAATDESGAVLWREAYQPFGERIDNEVSSKDNTPFYTGKPHDDDTGLSYFGARYYDPFVGRFLGTDPVDVDPNNLHSFNRYAYANNNPYTFIDPDGKFPFIPIAIFVAKELAGEIFEQTTGLPVTVKGVGKRLLKKGGTAAFSNATKNGKTFQTYTKTNPRTGQVYCGRTSGCGTPEQNIARRDAGHHMNKEGYGPAVLDKSSSNSAAIRGREQQVIDAFGGAKSTGGTSGNRINGISPKNPKRGSYLDQARRKFGG